jgi:hypothetical protein
MQHFSGKAGKQEATLFETTRKETEWKLANWFIWYGVWVSGDTGTNPWIPQMAENVFDQLSDDEFMLNVSASSS